MDYGVIDVDDSGNLRGFSEKPEVTSIVSMGVYVMEPEVLELIPANEPFDFPDLVHALTRDGRDVGVYRYSATGAISGDTRITRQPTPSGWTRTFSRQAAEPSSM